MIISIRGPSGSGKSSLVRKITGLYAYSSPYHVVGRRQPLFMKYIDPSNDEQLIVPGHYEIANGGIDTLPSLDAAYNIAREHDDKGRHVLMEGKCMSDGLRHVVALRCEHRDVRVIHVSTSIEECAASVERRGHKISRVSIERIHRKCLRDYYEFAAMQVAVFSGDRAACETKIREWLKL